ncbi:MAG: tetratricopeptide repeat protein [Cyclobacteriaceae bacterium]|jgi:tetratricopeptide (TPR) repeat protein
MEKDALGRKLRRYSRIGWTLALLGALLSSLGAFIAVPLWGGAIACFVVSTFAKQQLQNPSPNHSYQQAKSSTDSAPVLPEVTFFNAFIWVFGGILIIFLVVYMASGDEESTAVEATPTEQVPSGEAEPPTEELTPFDRASQAYNQGDYAQAKTIFEEITKNEPGNADAWLGLGNVYYSEKNYSAADGYYDRALSVRQDFIEALYNKALIRFDRKEYSSSSGILTQALLINPNYVDGLILQGDCSYASSNYSQARSPYRKAYDLGSRIPDLVHRLAWLEDREQNLKEAVKLYRETLELDPERKEIYARLKELDPGRAKAYEQNQLD